MFTGVNASKRATWSVSFCLQLRRQVTPDSCRLAYTARMHSPRSLHLLIAAAILFSQIASAIHMAGHVHAEAPLAAFAVPSAADGLTHPPGLTAAEHEALHRQGNEHGIASLTESGQQPTSMDFSCVIYHIYAGSQAAAAACVDLPATPHITLAGQTLTSPALLTLTVSGNAIRGPPHTS